MTESYPSKSGKLCSYNAPGLPEEEHEFTNINGYDEDSRVYGTDNFLGIVSIQEGRAEIYMLEKTPDRTAEDRVLLDWFETATGQDAYKWVERQLE